MFDLQHLQELNPEHEHEEDVKFSNLQELHKLEPEHQEPEHEDDAQLFDLQELGKFEPEQEEDVQFDPTVEPPVVTSSTKEPRWEEHLKSDLGKYWELPERTTRRARKQTSFFSPC